jgi:hypothetical protein
MPCLYRASRICSLGLAREEFNLAGGQPDVLVQRAEQRGGEGGCLGKPVGDGSGAGAAGMR